MNVTGHFQFVYFDLRKKKQIMKTKLGQTEDIVHLWNQCHLNMSNGTITIPPSAFKETIHSVGISFAIAMLYLLVKPKDILKTELEILERRKSTLKEQKWEQGIDEEKDDLRLCCGLDLLENTLFLDSRKERETEREREKQAGKETGADIFVLLSTLPRNITLLCFALLLLCSIWKYLCI